MRAILRFLGMLLVIGAVGSIFVAVMARMGDGPIGPFPGGALHRGELHEGPDPDWARWREVPELELQVDDLARRTWLLVVEGELFVPCIYPQIKRWPHQLMAGAPVVVRVEGERFPRRGLRVEDPGLIERLVQELERKYGMEVGADDAGAPENLWFFRLQPAA